MVITSSSGEIVSKSLSKCFLNISLILKVNGIKNVS